LNDDLHASLHCGVGLFDSGYSSQLFTKIYNGKSRAHEMFDVCLLMFQAALLYNDEMRRSHGWVWSLAEGHLKIERGKMFANEVTAQIGGGEPDRLT
jgi:hypothetical protein